MTSLEPVVGGGAVTGQRIGHGGAVGVRGVVRRSRGVIYWGRFTVGGSRGIICRCGLLVRRGRGAILLGRGAILLGRGAVLLGRSAVLCLVSRLIRASQEKVGEDSGWNRGILN